MDIIKAAIKCANCNKVLSIPVVLPCGHSICREHTKNIENNKQLLCHKCGKTHKISKQQEFPVNEPLMDMINAQIESVNFGHVHQATRDSCSQLSEQLMLTETILNDCECFLHDWITDSKNRVYLKSEELKLEIDNVSQNLITRLENYEKECKENFKEPSFQSSARELDKLKEQTCAKLTKWNGYLNELAFDENKCMQTKSDCDNTKNEFSQKLDSFKHTIFLNKMRPEICLIDDFCKTQITYTSTK